ncbi:MAG: 5-formyltetrahydrofolate cyclo-ligase [Gemmobacter sp.]
MTLAEEKAAARKAAAQRRAAAHAAGQGDAAARLAGVLAHHAGRVLAGYVAMRTEIDPSPALAGHTGPLCLPVVVGAGRPLVFRRWEPGQPLVPGSFGTQIPEPGPELVPEVLVVPLLAFDRAGFRLGYGGGFYDRTLAALRARGPVTAIGFAFAAQQMAAVPREATDQPLDLIVTEAELIRPQA